MDIFFPRSSAAACTNRPLEADLSVIRVAQRKQGRFNTHRLFKILVDPYLAGLVASVWPISVCFRCLRKFLGLSGLAIWAHSTRWITGCERDGGVHRVQVTTAQVVAFLLPLFGATSACTPCVARGVRLADVRVGRRRAPRSRRRDTSRSQPLCIFKEVLARQSCRKLCSARGGYCGASPGDSAVW
ncbi:hypothetical protein Taro_016922 [Colocasia esculenta]|uniref:Uncharacterized protein n=1 Tax=Colocasia esculenta TaxID=4460 RepID=A0A843UM56_COLES|nr:hypothetical protein [Colocasia esculenta]